MAADKARELKIDVDVSEALTGLKALQREARKAAAELKACEGYLERLHQYETILPKEQAEVLFKDLPQNSYHTTINVTESKADIDEIARRIQQAVIKRHD